MKRRIIRIDEEKCNGCGKCIPNCPEGALQLIDGKARLVSDLFCDGLGACIGECPLGAIRVVEREAEPYDERRVMEGIIRQGAGTIKAHLEHLRSHGEFKLLEIAIACLKERGIAVPEPAAPAGHPHGGCPGMLAKKLAAKPAGKPAGGASALRQWPVQLKLLNPAAEYFDNADLLISADCVAHAFGGFHKELLDGRDVKEPVRQAFHILPELVGGPEILDQALQCAPDENARLGVKRLQDIFRLLELYGAEDHITFDLSMSGNYGYYTGVIFRAYTYGTGDAIVRGGRYDHLLEKFGKSTPSIGFAIIVDELMSALSRQKIPTDTVHRNLIVYTEAAEDEAITLARAFRAKGRNIELMKNVPGTDRAVYEAHARRSGTTVLLFLNDDMKIEMINLETGEKRSTDLIIPD